MEKTTFFQKTTSNILFKAINYASTGTHTIVSVRKSLSHALEKSTAYFGSCNAHVALPPQRKIIGKMSLFMTYLSGGGSELSTYQHHFVMF